MNALAMRLPKILGAAFLLGPALAFAGTFNLTPNSVSGSQGGTTSPTMTFSFTGDGSTSDAQSDYDYDETNFTPAFAAVGGSGASCTIVSVAGNMKLRVVSPSGGASALPAGPTNYCTATFTIGAATPNATYPLTSANTLCGDSVGNPVAPCTAPNGSIVVAPGPQPTYGSVPAPLSTITINTSVGVTGTQTLVVNNTAGQVGSTLTVQPPSGLSGILSIAPNTIQNIPQAGPNVTYTISCNSAAVTTSTQTLTMTHNAAGSPATYTVTCNVAAAPAPVYASAPIPGSTINISAPVGGSNTSTLTVSNTGNATLNINAPSGLSAPISIAPNTAQSIASAGAPINYTITCSPVAVGVTTQTLTMAHNAAGSPATYTVNCTGSNPAYTSAPVPGSTITINTPAGTPATQNLNINNTGSVGSTLNVSAPSGLVAPISIAPNTAQAIPQGGAGVNYTITCNSADAGTFTQTLTFTHNGSAPGSPSPATYTVTCNATGPEYNSNPPSGGTLAMQGPPGLTASNNIAVTNTGTTDLILSGCVTAPVGPPTNFTAPAGLTVTPGATGTLAVSCTAPAAPGTTANGTLTCTTNDANEGSVNFNLTCSSLVTSIPTLSSAGKMLLATLVLGLGMLGFALRRQSA